MIIIELSGVSGIGKTYFSHGFKEVYYNRSVDCKMIMLSDFLSLLHKKSHIYRLYFRLRYCSPRTAFWAYLLVAYVKPFTKERLKYLHSYLMVMASYKYLSKNERLVVFADEGQIQRLTSVIYPGQLDCKRMQRIVRRLAIISKRIIYVFLTCDTKLIEERLDTRVIKQSRIDKLDQPERREMISYFAELLAKIDSILSGLGAATINYDLTNSEYDKQYDNLIDVITDVLV